MEQLPLDRLVEHLDEAFGGDLPFAAGALSPGQLDTLRQVFGDHGYQAYLQDQVNRQIIRDYLVNAVMLGFLPEGSIADMTRQLSCTEGRAALSLHMLMSSVEQAADVVAHSGHEHLKKLKSGTKLPPYIKLIQG